MDETSAAGQSFKSEKNACKQRNASLMTVGNEEELSIFKRFMDDEEVDFVGVLTAYNSPLFNWTGEQVSSCFVIANFFQLI
jgi:hypothetical protein